MCLLLSLRLSALFCLKVEDKDVLLLLPTSSGIDSTNLSPPFKRVDTAKSAKSILLMLMLMLMLMEKLKNTDGIPPRSCQPDQLWL